MDLYIDSNHEFYMRVAYIVARRSKDPRTKIGSVLVRDNDIISVGWNGFARKVTDSNERWNNRELKNDIVCHSEFNSCLNAARKGISTKESNLYTFGIPCKNCTNALIQAGVVTIFCHKQWPNMDYDEKWVKSTKLSLMLMKEADISLQWLDKELGMQGLLNEKVVNV